MPRWMPRSRRFTSPANRIRTMPYPSPPMRWVVSLMESFFKTLKVERIYQVRYATRAQARLDIVNWIEGFYNHTPAFSHWLSYAGAHHADRKSTRLNSSQ